MTVVRRLVAEALIAAGNALRSASRGLVGLAYRVLGDEEAERRLLADLTRTVDGPGR